MRKLLATVIFVGTAAFTLSANAQSDNDCRVADDRVKQVRTCTQMIANAGDDQQKISIGFLYRCQAHDMLGNYELAVEDCLESLKFGEDASTHNSLAIIYQNMKRYDESIAESTKAIKGNSDRANYYNTRANGNCAAKNFEAAYQDRMAALQKGHFTAEGLQKAMKSRGFYEGAIDGNFDAASQTAVKTWTYAGCP